MRLPIVLALLLGAAAGHTSAEVQLPPPSVHQRSSASNAEHEAAIANCVQLWDRGTHMTERQWQIACRRVQDRLFNLQTK